MKKKLKYIVFLLLMLFISINGTYALTCKYTDEDLNVDFEINESDYSVLEARIEGKMTTSDNSHKKGIDEKEGISNWNTYYSPVASNNFYLPALGEEYYKKNKKCIPYAFVVDRMNGLDLLVATEEYVESLKEFGKTKQGYAVLKLVISEQAESSSENNESSDDNDTNDVDDTNDSSENASKCTYWSDSDKIGYEFNIKNGRAKRGLLYGKYDNQENVQNWDISYGSTLFVGKTYYENNNGKCPENVIFVKTDNNKLVFVSNSDSLEEIKSEIKSNYINVSPLILSFVPNNSINTNKGSCMGYTNPISCETNDYYSCIWNDTEYGSYCNTDKLLYVKCGDSSDIPYQAPRIISFIITLLKTAVPIILIFTSVFSLLKAVGATNEDEIKKAQKSLIRKIISAALVFFIVSIVQFVIMKVADNDDINDISSCLSCFMNGDCDSSVYYKTNVGGTYKCTTVKDNIEIDCLGND